MPLACHLVNCQALQSENKITDFWACISFDVEQRILERSLSDISAEETPYAKRQKSAEPLNSCTIAAKVEKNSYRDLDEFAHDILSAIQATLKDAPPNPIGNDECQLNSTKSKIHNFRDRAMELLYREKAYPQTSVYALPKFGGDHSDWKQGDVVLSVTGYAPNERRLFSSLSASVEADFSKTLLPPGVTMTRVMPVKPKTERTQTLGELFSSVKSLPPLHAPKQPRTQAKGNKLDFYQPELTDRSRFTANNYFNTKLSSGHYLDYTNATASAKLKTKQHERAQSLAGKKPSSDEAESIEMEALFRGAFSSFAPCKDDSAALVSSNVAGRMWWQRAGQKQFQTMIEVEYYDGADDMHGVQKQEDGGDVDEAALQDAIDNWDAIFVDPTLEEAMGIKPDNEEKEIDEILDEVSDMIQTLSSYQRIRNLTLPNSHNRQSSDPVSGDMLATPGPSLSEEEQATYQMLKAQLTLIIKTLPPYAVAKLNGDQLDELLVSTKVQVSTDQYKGTMEEDASAVQARKMAQQQVTPAAPRAPLRTASASSTYTNQFQPQHQYATPNRAPPPSQDPFYRQAMTPTYQQPRPFPPQSAPQPRMPQPNQYTRVNGYSNQYATQLAKAQTPYGHQNMQQQYASQQRPSYGQASQQPTPQARMHQPGYHQQSGTPSHGGYNSYTNGVGGSIPARNMSPQINRSKYSASPNMPAQPPRYGTPTQMQSQMSRFQAHAQPAGPTGYHTVISEAQQQRILEQARARVAAQERSASFGDRMSQPGMSFTAQMAARSASISAMSKPQTPVPPRQVPNGTPASNYVPHKVTPVPIPTPGLPPQNKMS